VDPVPDPLLPRKSGRAGTRNPGPLDLQPESLTTRPQRRSHTWACDIYRTTVGEQSSRMKAKTTLYILLLDAT
jgi:hypothetical protein